MKRLFTFLFALLLATPAFAEEYIDSTQAWGGIDELTASIGFTGNVDLSGVSFIAAPGPGQTVVERRVYVRWVANGHRMLLHAQSVSAGGTVSFELPLGIEAGPHLAIDGVAQFSGPSLKNEVTLTVYGNFLP